MNERLFREYEKIRLSGEYNMIVDAEVVIEKLGCNIQDYYELTKNYKKYSEFYKNKE